MIALNIIIIYAYTLQDEGGLTSYVVHSSWRNQARGFWGAGGLNTCLNEGRPPSSLQEDPHKVLETQRRGLAPASHSLLSQRKHPSIGLLQPQHPLLPSLGSSLVHHYPGP